MEVEIKHLYFDAPSNDVVVVEDPGIQKLAFLYVCHTTVMVPKS